MRNRILIFIALVIAPLNLLLGACEDNGLPTSPPVAVVDGGRDVRTTDGSDSTIDASGPVSDAGKECGTPAKVFEFGDGGVFCPFSAPNPGDKNVYCSSGTEMCCVTPESANTPSTCEDRGPDAGCPIPNSTPLECGHPEDCGDAGQCCAYSNSGTVGYNQDVCGPYLSKFNGTKCRNACQAGELVVCGKNADCKAGETCVAVKPKGNNTGVCR